VSGLLTLKNPAGVDTGLAICVGEARSIAHQATGFGKGTQGIDRRHPMVGRQRNDVYATVVEQRAGTYQQRSNRLLGKPRQRPYQCHGRWWPRRLRFASRWTTPQPERPRQRTGWGRSWDRPARQRARLPAATHATIQVALPQAEQWQT